MIYFKFSERFTKNRSSEFTENKTKTYQNLTATELHYNVTEITISFTDINAGAPCLTERGCTVCTTTKSAIFTSLPKWK